MVDQIQRRVRLGCWWKGHRLPENICLEVTAVWQSGPAQKMPQNQLKMLCILKQEPGKSVKTNMFFLCAVQETGSALQEWRDQLFSVISMSFPSPTHIHVAWLVLWPWGLVGTVGTASWWVGDPAPNCSWVPVEFWRSRWWQGGRRAVASFWEGDGCLGGCSDGSYHSLRVGYNRSCCSIDTSVATRALPKGLYRCKSLTIIKLAQLSPLLPELVPPWPEHAMCTQGTTSPTADTWTGEGCG